MGVESLRVLLVEDFGEFRGFVCSLLEPRLEAVQKAEELRPDLILLDISLPRLNGMEVARRVLKLAPDAKILFLSVESDADLVIEALSLGSGYIHKLRASRDLLPAIDAVLRGEQFVSSGLLPTLPSGLVLSNSHPELSEVVARAIEMAGADMGNLQILNPRTNNLHIAAQVGLSKRFLEFFETVQHNQGACGTAMARGQRVIVDNVASNPIFRGTKAREIILKEGVRAVQSIPLTTPSGQLVGVLSTHFRIARPSRHQLFKVTDTFAREVAELIRSKMLAFT